MTRHGRCHCGQILQFHRGPDGFKERCPRCGSVVRLRAGERREAAPSSPPPTYNDGAPPAASVSEPFSAPPPELLAVSEGPVMFVEMVPLAPAPAQSWTRGQILLLLAAALVALAVGAVICLGVWWIATR